MISFLRRILPEQHPLRLLWHHIKGFVAALRYGFPGAHLHVIGITGTDGKTTTVGMVAHALAAAGIRCGALSTAFFRIGHDVQFNATQKTSPSPFLVQKFLRQCVRAGCTHVVLECSSHGLTQGRVAWTWPDIAAITNISPEHLDYHGTMERYMQAKSLLFTMLQSNGIAVLNANDQTFESYSKLAASQRIAFGSPKLTPGIDRRVWHTDHRATEHGMQATLHWNDGITSGSAELSLPIHGAFNLDNACCAIACLWALGRPPEATAATLADFEGVPGRMERIDEGQPYRVYVDFTVTPASYEATLGTLRSSLQPNGRLLVLTGSCGDRMREKRPEIGRICGTMADVVVVTNEDPYTEDPERIIDEVLAGAKGHPAQTHRIVDRLDAMRFILRQARPGDIVLLSGKGSDTTMWLKHGKVPWDERAIIRKLLNDSLRNAA